MQKRNLLFLLSGLLTWQATRAQETIWYNAIWKKTTADSAEYILTKTKTDSGWAVAIRYRSGAPEMTGLYADDSMKVQMGVFHWWNDKGVEFRSCTFDKGKTSGPETLFDERGHVMLKGENFGGERTGTWTAYFSSGKVAGTAVYKAGKESSLVLFNEDGTPNKAGKVFEQDAEFPGGKTDLLRYFNKSLKYPDYAVKHSIQGTVVVKFRVTRDGQVMDARVTYTTDKHLDAEALRVIREMPEWKPAVVGGQPREAIKIQPVVFKIE